MKCVVLAGGAGLRLWPLSRNQYPKQFLKLEGENSLFVNTINRNKSILNDFMIITNDSYRFIAEKEISKIKDINYEFVYETIGKNTAPAIAISAMLSDPEEIIFVVASDAYIQDVDKYKEAVREAERLAYEGSIVTFGINPSFANTEYGYIKFNGNSVIEFKEKPDSITAKKYYDSGEYLWNSGMFMFKSRVLLEELKKYRKDIFDACNRIYEIIKDKKNPTLPKDFMENVPSESIDYAVMEKSSLVKVVPAYFKWNDVGSLEAVSDIIEKYDGSNTFKGSNLIVNNCENTSIINETKNKLVVVNGLKDIVIANTNNAVYISKKGVSPQIKNIINDNLDVYGEYFNENILNYRPWGYYEILENAKFYKVKSIVVYPGKRLSLQKHQYRSEHWVIVKGIANVTIGDVIKEYRINESVYIPIGEVHRLENKSEEILEIIEIATGSIISEDDIIRLDDDYGRVE